LSPQTGGMFKNTGIFTHAAVRGKEKTSINITPTCPPRIPTQARQIIY
jgi:hypothetical protein